MADNRANQLVQSLGMQPHPEGGFFVEVHRSPHLTEIFFLLRAGDVSLWPWLIIFGYFAGDTTTTTILRMFVANKWYGEHRSHAYQNLARIWGSHLRVVRGVALYQLVWLLPLAVWSVLTPSIAPVAARPQSG